MNEPKANQRKYDVQINGEKADVYDVLQAFNVVNPALQHLIKKALKVGQRGHKDEMTDYQDIIDSAVRAKQIASKGGD
jgi:glutamyl-tRNA reductase